MEQTAINWLKDKLKETYNKEGKLPLAYTLHLVEQAKQMEKEQIAKAWDGGNYQYFCSVRTNEDFDNGYEYYEEQYKSE